MVVGVGVVAFVPCTPGVISIGSGDVVPDLDGFAAGRSMTSRPRDRWRGVAERGRGWER